MRKNHLWKVAAIAVVLGVVAGCKGKTGNDSADSKGVKATDYPVVEISDGLAKIAQTYSKVYEFHDGLAKVQGGSLYGLIDMDGNEVIPCSYSEIEVYGKVLLVCKSSWGVIDINGKEIIPCLYNKENIAVFPEEELIRIKKGMQEYHFFTYQGKDLFPNGLRAVIGSGLEWNKDDLVTFSEGLASASISTNDPYHTYGFVDKDGKVVIPARFRYPAIFVNGIARVDNSSFIDKQGNTIMEVKKEGEFIGLVDNKGNEIIPCRYKGFETYEKGLLITKGSNNRYGIWNVLEKKEIAQPLYDYIRTDYDEKTGFRFFQKDGIILVQNNDKYGAIDIQGKEIVPCHFQFADVVNGVVEVNQEVGSERIYGIYAKDGKEILKCEYNRMEIGTFGILAFKRDSDDRYSGTQYLYDMDGNEIMAVKNGSQLDFRQLSEGLAAIKQGTGGFRFYDGDGDEAFDTEYEDAGYFSEGMAPVKFNGKWGYVNHAGKDTFNN